MKCLWMAFIFILGCSNSQVRRPNSAYFQGSAWQAGSRYIDHEFFLSPNWQRHYLEYSVVRNSKTIDFLALPQYVIESYIDMINPRRSQINLSTTKLSDLIVRTSFCFGIDPFMFTAMIEKESTFRQDARSETYAVGFTQMTTIGIKEVNQHLGYVYPKETPARKKNIDFFTNEAIPCLTEEWNDIWLSVAKEKMTSPRAMKSWLLEDTTGVRSMVYGATLLKVYLSLKYKKGLSMIEVYRRAFRAYNGSSIKHKYADDILDYYERISRLSEDVDAKVL